MHSDDENKFGTSVKIANEKVDSDIGLEKVREGTGVEKKLKI